jgi:hypothetical protein
MYIPVYGIVLIILGVLAAVVPVIIGLAMEHARPSGRQGKVLYFRPNARSRQRSEEAAKREGTLVVVEE